MTRERSSEIEPHDVEMTRERAIEVLKSLQDGVDPQSEHETADDILCRLLVAIGYADVVREWGKVSRWYS